MILIQRIRKINPLSLKASAWRRLLKKKIVREILWDSVSYLFFFVIGVSFVFLKIEKGRETPLILEQKTPTEAQSIEETTSASSEAAKYVASSRGKYFYEVGSSRANSLSEKNKLYFSSMEEAKKLGFKPYIGN